MGPVNLYFIITGMKNGFQTHDNDFFFSTYTKNTEIIEHKNDDFQLIYCCQWFQFWHTNNQLAVMFPCQQKKNLGGICLALQWGHSKLWILSVYKTVLWKAHLIEFYAYLWTCQVNKVKQALHVICICKQKTFDQLHQCIYWLNKH